MIVLDTHVLIWWVDGSNRLSATASTAIENELQSGDGAILVSVISA